MTKPLGTAAAPPTGPLLSIQEHAKRLRVLLDADRALTSSHAHSTLTVERTCPITPCYTVKWHMGSTLLTMTSDTFNAMLLEMIDYTYLGDFEPLPIMVTCPVCVGTLDPNGQCGDCDYCFSFDEFTVGDS